MTPLARDAAAELSGYAARGGPSPGEDAAFLDLLARVWDAARTGALPPEELRRVREVIPASPDSAQGFAFLKPNGYPGCYETIDRVYRHHASDDPALAGWDRFFHAQPATRAVRNRMAYFKDWLAARAATARAWRLLNLASGPCRDVSEYFAAAGPDLGRVRCVDRDARALAFARDLCRGCGGRVSFERADAVRYRPQSRYDLVWSAGLFDYLPDRLFVRLLARVRHWTVPGGEVVVGNFSTDNPTRAYMEVVLDWRLHHRTEADLRSLATAAGFAPGSISVGREPLGINLFLHLRASPP